MFFSVHVHVQQEIILKLNSIFKFDNLEWVINPPAHNVLAKLNFRFFTINVRKIS